jgi:quinol monooxygenase YgiN
VAYVRLSLMTPSRGEEDHVVQLQRDLVRYFSSQPGYVEGYVLKAPDGSGQVGRIGVWESEAAADQAANSDHVMAVRSQLNQMITGEHNERSFLAD